MALDDPSITKVMFESVGDWREVTVDPNTVSRLACVVSHDIDKWHVEIVDLAPGVFTVTCKAKKNGDIYFETVPRKSFIPKKYKPARLKSRYD